MAWTAFPTWVVGQVSLASDWNTYVAANMNFLATPPFCRVYRTAALTLTSGNTNVTMPYDTVQVDTQSGFSLSTHLYTAPVAGQYWMVANYLLNPATVGDTYLNTLFISNTEQSSYWEVATAGTWSIQVTDVIPNVSVGSTLYSVYNSGSAAPLSVGPTSVYMTILKVSN